MRRIAIPTLLGRPCRACHRQRPAKAAAGITVAIEDEDVFVNGISGVTR
jgi:hypothetical protein